MKNIKYLILTVAVIITLVLMTATMIETTQGTTFVKDNIYSSVWFVVLWALLAFVGSIYLMGKKLYKRLPVFLLHLAFLVILLGALVSWLTAESGELHIRKGETTSLLQLKDGKKKNLGFPVKLNHFNIVYYPGTDAPMDYVSQVTVGDTQMDVSMNNIGKYEGYRFTQAGYDSDMQGTRFGVSHDPWGIGITYTGYALLFVSLLLMLFSKRTRMRGYYRKAMNGAAQVVFLIFCLSAATQTASAQERIQMDKHLADEFSKICVLYNSRICPINTVATNFVTKLSGKPSWDGLSANEIFMGWVFDVMDWEEAKMIEVKDKDMQHLLGLQDKWACFNDFINEYNEYKLEKPLQEASQQGDQTKLKKLREVDEKFNVIRMLYGGELLRMFPYTDKQGKMTWLAPGEKNVHGNLPEKEWYFVRKSMDYLAESIISGNKERAATLIGKIYDYQHVRGAQVIPSTAAVHAELTYNAINARWWIVIVYLTFALLIVVCSNVAKQTVQNKKNERIVAYVLMGIMLLHTTLLLALRWWISGHLPMSNGFETMLFMSWAVLLITLFTQRRFPIIGKFGLLLAAFALLVAMITDRNPQITPLMPVLQSPLLSVHVMVIMFSYALLGLMALIGIQGLVAHHQASYEKEESLAALSRFLLYPAVALLAIGIFVGAIWANVSWGTYWSWDAKEVWALITMLIYSAPLHEDLKWLRKSHHLHLYMVLAFLSVLMTYFGVNYFLGGMHSYA